jgi:hypothetical protein
MACHFATKSGGIWKFQEEIAPAGLAEPRVHRLFVEDPQFLAPEPGVPKDRRKLGLELALAFGSGGGQIGKNVMRVDGAWDMPALIALWIACRWE